MQRVHCGLKAVLHRSAAGTAYVAVALAGAASGALAQQLPASPLVIDAAPPPPDPVVLDGSKIYSTAVIGQDNPDQVVDITGDTLILSGLTIGAGAASSNNQVTAVSGTLINGSITEALVVGDMGSGNLLSIGSDPGAGLVVANSLIIGQSAGASQNQLLVQSGNLLNTVISLYVGAAGSQNAVTVAEGGYLFSAAAMLGQATGADGNMASVSGDGALWQLDASNGYLVIGDAGNGNRVEVTDGGTLSLLTSSSPESPTSLADIFIGGYGGGSGNELYVASGGTVSHPGAIHVGEVGSNNLLTLDAGGSLTSTYAILGYGAGSNGNMADIEFDGTWNIDSEDGWLISGLSGSDNLVYVNGGTVNIANAEGTASPAQTPDIVIGALGGSGNGLSIGYSGQVSHPDAISVGENGSANQLKLFFDGDLVTGGTAYIGGGPDFSVATFGGSRQAADNNIADVDGTGTSWSIGGELYIGAGFAPSSNGNQLIVGHGAAVSAAGSAYLGFDATSDGNLLSVSGLDNEGNPTSFTTLGDIWVGVGASADLESGSFSGNMLEAGTASGDYYGTVNAARIFVGRGNSLALGGGGVVNTGEIQFGSASSYLVHIDTTAPGALEVSGNAVENGTVSMSFGATFDNRYVILSSASSTGAFSLDTSNLAPGLTAQIDQQETDTGQETAISFVSNFAENPNLTGNETAVAAAIDKAFNGGSSIPGELATVDLQPEDQAASAAGSAAAVAARPVIDGPRTDLGLVKGRLSTLTGEVGAGGGTQAVMQASRSFLSLVIANGEAPSPAAGDMQVWSGVFGASATLPGNGGTGSHDTDLNLAGLAAGWQRGVAGGRRVGLAMAGGVTGWSLAGTPGKGDSSFLQLGAFAAQRAGNFHLAAAAGLAMHAMATDRTVSLRRSNHYDSDYTSTDASFRLEAGYAARVSDHAELIPYGAFEAHHIATAGHDEQTMSGRDSFALSYDGGAANLLRSELGLGFEFTSAGEAPRVTFAGRAAWAHDWNNGLAAQAGFEAIPGAGFTVTGAETPANVALLSASLSGWITERVEATGSVTGEAGENYDNLSGSIGLALPF